MQTALILLIVPILASLAAVQNHLSARDLRIVPRQGIPFSGRLVPAPAGADDSLLIADPSGRSLEWNAVERIVLPGGPPSRLTSTPLVRIDFQGGDQFYAELAEPPADAPRPLAEIPVRLGGRTVHIPRAGVAAIVRPPARTLVRHESFDGDRDLNSSSGEDGRAPLSDAPLEFRCPEIPSGGISWQWITSPAADAPARAAVEFDGHAPALLCTWQNGQLQAASPRESPVQISFRQPVAARGPLVLGLTWHDGAFRLLTGETVVAEGRGLSSPQHVRMRGGAVSVDDFQIWQSQRAAPERGTPDAVRDVFRLRSAATATDLFGSLTSVAPNAVRYELATPGGGVRTQHRTPWTQIERVFLSRQAGAAQPLQGRIVRCRLHGLGTVGLDDRDGGDDPQLTLAVARLDAAGMVGIHPWAGEMFLPWSEVRALDVIPASQVYPVGWRSLHPGDDVQPEFAASRPDGRTGSLVWDDSPAAGSKPRPEPAWLWMEYAAEPHAPRSGPAETQPTPGTPLEWILDGQRLGTLPELQSTAGGSGRNLVQNAHAGGRRVLKLRLPALPRGKHELVWRPAGSAGVFNAIDLDLRRLEIWRE